VVDDDEVGRGIEGVVWEEDGALLPVPLVTGAMSFLAACKGNSGLEMSAFGT
jgi:hypothetical protein